MQAERLDQRQALSAHEEQDDLGLAIPEGSGWKLLHETAVQAVALTGKISADSLGFVTGEISVSGGVSLGVWKRCTV